MLVKSALLNMHAFMVGSCAKRTPCMNGMGAGMDSGFLDFTGKMPCHRVLQHQAERYLIAKCGAEPFTNPCLHLSRESLF